jgi:hypothetical protein
MVDSLCNGLVEFAGYFNGYDISRRGLMNIFKRVVKICFVTIQEVEIH